MRNLLIVGAIVSVVGIPAFLLLEGGTFGVSEQHPLGQFECIEAWLLDRGFHKKLLEAVDAHDATGGERFEYLDVERTRAYDHPHWVRVHLDPTGLVRRVRASFFSGDDEMRHPRTPVESFVGRLWVEAAGDKPRFEDERSGKGRHMRFHRVADFEAGSAHGRWRKSFQAPLERHSILDLVDFTLRR